MLLSELVEKAIDHAKMREKKTIARLNLVVRHINDIVGHPARLNEVTKQVMIRLRDDAKYLPARPKSYEKLTRNCKLPETQRKPPRSSVLLLSKQQKRRNKQPRSHWRPSRTSSLAFGLQLTRTCKREVYLLRRTPSGWHC